MNILMICWKAIWMRLRRPGRDSSGAHSQAELRAVERAIHTPRARALSRMGKSFR